YHTIPKLICNGLRALLGYKIEFNKASAPFEKNKPTWYLLNHMSIADFIVAGSTLKGTFAGKGEILTSPWCKWSGISHLVRAVNYIGLRRKSEHNDESRGKIAQNFNAGFNTIMFPEGTTSRGDKLYLFRGALLGLLYGEKAVAERGV